MAKRNQKIVADICLYGTSTIGAGWLAQTADGKMLGNGEPREGRAFTEAVWLAADEVRQSGVKAGVVRIFAAGGTRMSKADINHIPYYGQLVWEAAPVMALAAIAPHRVWMLA